MNQKLTLNEKVRQITRQLEVSENHEDFRLLRALEDSDYRLFSDGDIDLFLVPISAEQTEEVERLQGLFTSVTEYVIQGNLKITFLQVKTSSDHRSIFAPFISEFLSKDLSNPESSLVETLKEWRTLWLGNSGKLSWMEQRGLLGELFVLNKLLSMGTPSLAQYWVGPNGKTHDFESARINLEVKTTIKQPATVNISLIKQVAPMEGNKLLNLVVVGLEEGENITLPSLVEDCRNQLADTIYVSGFENVLLKSGYRDHDKAFYSKSYDIGFLQFHKITDESPVLNPRVIGEIPSTVTNIKYTLDVHGMDMTDLTEEHWVQFRELFSD